MARVLVVEDDRAIGELVRLYLRRDGHEVELIDDGSVGLHRFEATADRTDLLILDLMLPGLDGRGVCRRIRARGGQAGTDVPVIMLTALDDDRDKIEGFDLGADDYLTKPFNPQELVARVRAVLRRAARPPRDAGAAEHERGSGEAIALGAARLDPPARRLTVDDREVPLRTKEFDLLAALADHPGVVHTRDQLLERVWGGDFSGDTRTVDVHVSRLRDKLTESGTGLAIETVRSVGYRLAVGGQ